MRRIPFGFLIFASLALAAPGETIELQPGVQIELADVEMGAKLLGNEDAYLRRLSAFERAAKMRVAAPPSLEEFARNAAASVRGFSDGDRERIGAALAELRPLIEPLRLAFPGRITLVKTTGRDDINEAYCRGPVIVLPRKYFAPADSNLAAVVLHELFHVFSSHHSELRERLYALLDFHRCAELTLPEREDRRRFTNPDAMNFDYYTVLRHDGREIAVMPVLLGKRERFDPAVNGSVLGQIDLALVEIEVRDGRAIPVLDGEGRAVVRLAEEVPAYMQRMARNTGYILHPEEVLADNFMHVLRKPAGLAAPELPAQLLEIMQSAPGRSVR